MLYAWAQGLEKETFKRASRHRVHPDVTIPVFRSRTGARLGRKGLGARGASVKVPSLDWRFDVGFPCLISTVNGLGNRAVCPQTRDVASGSKRARHSKRPPIDVVT